MNKELNQWGDVKSGEQVPEGWLDAQGRANQGRYQGIVRDLSWSPLGEKFTRDSLSHRFLQLVQFKRWVYFFVNHPEVSVSGAIVHTGYGLSAFVTAIEVKTGERIYDRSEWGVPGIQGEFEVRGGSQYEARYSSLPVGGFEMEVTQAHVRVEDPARGFTLSVDLDESLQRWGHAWSVVGEQGHLPVTRPVYTQKEVAVASPRGEVRAKGRFKAIWEDVGSGICVGTDLTLGFLPRKTQWDWAFGFGRDEEGGDLGWNLSSANHLGFPLGESAVCVGGKWLPLSGLRWTPLASDTGRAKVVAGDGSLEMEFQSLAIHEEKRNLGLIRSDFSQWTGLFSGRIRDPGSLKWREFKNIRGQWELQSVLW